MATDLEANPKKSRTRSPAYPYLDLRAALDKAAVLWREEGRHAAAMNVVMHHWGYKDESSTGYSCMAALKKFGLIDHDGTGENKQIRLSTLALAILLDENPDSPERAEALRTAALSPRIHAELWERYGSDLPSDQSLKRHLVLEKSFNESVVDELLAEYKQTIGFAGLNLVSAPSAAVPNGFAYAAHPAAPPVPPPASQSSPAFAPVPGRQGGQAAPAAPVPASELPYDDWREAGPPARAIGPANGTRREVDPYDLPVRESHGGERQFVPPARNGESNGNESRRRPVLTGYAQDGRRPADRERARYDQESFGYEEEYFPPSRANGFQPQQSQQPPASSPAVPAAGQTPLVEPDAPNGIPHKELPVPLDGDRVALVPYPMTEEDFSLLIATLQLWKKRLVRAGRD